MDIRTKQPSRTHFLKKGKKIFPIIQLLIFFTKACISIEVILTEQKRKQVKFDLTRLLLFPLHWVFPLCGTAQLQSLASAAPQDTCAQQSPFPNK